MPNQSGKTNFFGNQQFSLFADEIERLLKIHDDRFSCGILIRLKSDQRIRKVLIELLKKARTPSNKQPKYLHHAKLTWPEFVRLADKNERIIDPHHRLESPLKAYNFPQLGRTSKDDRFQLLNALLFFRLAVQFTTTGQESGNLRRVDVGAEKNFYMEMAARLRTEIRHLHLFWAKGRQVLRSDELYPEAFKLEIVASDLETRGAAMGKLLRQTDMFSRDTGNTALRAFVTSMSIATKQLFGSVLLGTLATLANVVFDRRDIDGSRVRSLLGQTPAVKHRQLKP